ncbi:E3 ubiquitin ligase TRAF3IP2 [Stigmatopora nigra]
MLPACKTLNSSLNGRAPESNPTATPGFPINSNTPQEDDETMSASAAHEPDSPPFYERSVSSGSSPDTGCYPPAPFPSLADGGWPPSGLSGEPSGCSGGAEEPWRCGSGGGFRSEGDLSLEPPCSLRSEPLGPCCCTTPPLYWPRGGGAKAPWIRDQALQYCDCKPPWGRFPPSGRSAVPVEKMSSRPSMSLSLEQRRVFVTYEADDEAHVNEIIQFVALLRHNGFDTHIDLFEQQFRSISKIDFMERYLSEKEYLIIIIISPKYHETVTASHVSPENDERTCNTIYIHKQLQNEFIQNGSKNFRFIPILFPGAKKSHVPNWLLNTHVYGWPRDRDDILRRLMRVEKYNPPPIGELPTIVSIPI